MKHIFIAIAFIVFGFFFLANNFGWIDMSLSNFIRNWWPIVLIGVGLGMLLKRK